MTATIAEPQKAYELKITRTFDAPRELVWKACTDPAMFAHWRCPRGFHVTGGDMPSHPGGEWHITAAGKRPGTEQEATIAQHGRVLEFDPPRKLAYTFAWTDRSCVGLGPSPYTENTVTMLFEEKGNKTVMTFTQGPFATEEECQGHTGGWNSAFDKFAEFVLAEQPNRTPDPNDVPTELHLKRVFHAPQQLVFDAWTNPEMLAQWFGPYNFTNTVHKWETRRGGEIHIVMHSPDGVNYPMAGRFVDIYPPFRFHFTASALDSDGNPIFENWNSVFFEEVEEGTRVTLDVHVTTIHANASFYLKGMADGWSQSLDKLSDLLTKQ
jgi:uncharacterized protein YndB with AHSA1/START domain